MIDVYFVPEGDTIVYYDVRLLRVFKVPSIFNPLEPKKPYSIKMVA